MIFGNIGLCFMLSFTLVLFVILLVHGVKISFELISDYIDDKSSKTFKDILIVIEVNLILVMLIGILFLLIHHFI